MPQDNYKEKSLYRIIKSLFGSTDEVKREIINSIFEQVGEDLHPQEKAIFQFLKSGFDDLHQFQTEELFLRKFPEYKAILQDVEPLDDQSLDYHKREFIEDHKKTAISKKLMVMASGIQTTGLTPDMVESLRDSVTVKEDEVSLQTSNVLDLYERAKEKGDCGIKTYIPEIDQIVGSIEPGTLTTIVGYTGHGKTSLALNIAYKAAKEGKNVVYISLEVPERNLLYNLISLHSTDIKLGVTPIPNHAILLRTMDSKQESDFKKVASDFNKNILPNFRILTERNFKDFSYGEIRDVLYRVDAEKRIDAIFVDQASLFKYYAKNKYANIYESINDYVSFFRKLAICFKVEDGKDRQMIIVLLAQCNRTGFLKAVKAGKKDPANEGRYDDTAVSESHELSRSASYLLTMYSSEGLRLSKEARVQLLKSRFGQTHEDPIAVTFDPEYCQVGEMGETSSVNDYSNVSPFENLMNLDGVEMGFTGFGSIDTSDL